jgi:phosphate transport system substrate-binding protein
MSPKSHKHLHYNVALVDKLWNLKRLCEAHLKMHIPLNMVLKDEDYRAELLEKALSANNDELTSLVWDVRHMEDSIVTATHTGDEFKPKKKVRGGIKLNFIAVEWVFAALIFAVGSRRSICVRGDYRNTREIRG